MKSDTPELQTILDRLENLETENQRLRRCGVAFLVLLAAFVLMGQAGSFERVVEAQKFVLKDNEGNVRGWLGAVGRGSELTLGNINAQPMMRLVVSTNASDLHFFGSQKSGMNLGLDSGNPDISMIGAEGKGGARITFTEYGPSLTLEDEKGFSTIVGSAQAEKSTIRKADLPSVASILLLDKNKKVIWQAP